MSEVERRHKRTSDFAFFVANFGFTKDEFLDLTPKETAFILKAWENKVVLETSLQNRAVVNAVGNVFRKKGAKWAKLWQKKAEPTNKDEQQNLLSAVDELEQKNGKDWVTELYRASGREVPKRGKQL